MHRQRLRALAALFGVTALGDYVVGDYLLGEKLFGNEPTGDLGFAITVFVAGLAVSWLIGRVPEGWPRREPRPWESLPPEMDKVRELARAGRRLQAMRMYRDLTGADVATSRFVVSSLAAGVPDGGHGKDRDQAAERG